MRPLTGISIMLSAIVLVIVSAVLTKPVSSGTFPGTNGKIAFISDRDGDWEIYVMDADGSNQTRLTNNVGVVLTHDHTSGSTHESGPSWSPDGSKILFISDQDGDTEIYVMDADGSNQAKLTDNEVADWQPSWSPDGTKIVFGGPSDLSDLHALYIMNADGSNRALLVTQYHSFHPEWSPDGTEILFERLAWGKTYAGRINVDGSNERFVGYGNYFLTPSWSPDGSKWIYYYVNPYQQGLSKLQRSIHSDSINVSTSSHSGSVTWIIENSFHSAITDKQPKYSPNGENVTFVSDRDGNSEIYVMDADGSNQTRLTNNSASDLYPSWGVPAPPPTPTPTPTPTATPVPPTATPVPPTATPVPPPPTATSVPPTATPVPPTATPVPPTATPIPPTATPVPPTATPIPPTATPIPPTATPVPQTFTPEPVVIATKLRSRRPVQLWVAPADKLRSMAVSNLVQAGATTEDIADKLLVTANVVKAYVAKARTSASESLIGMVVTNLLQTGASDEDIADTLAVSGDTVEGLISNLPMRINGEEEDSSGSRSKPVRPPVANTPVPAAPTAVPQVAPVPTPTAAPTPTAIRAAKLLPKNEDTKITESPKPAPKLDSYSSDAQGRKVLGILGIILSPLLLVAHSHAMRSKTHLN